MTVTFAAVGGFLGAGKTTTLTALAGLLSRRGTRVALITNDQGEELVDTAVARSAAGVPVAEVTGGCFCCRFEDLLDVAVRCVEAHGAEVILAEAVGSCTDLQATVVRPLERLYGDRFAVAPLLTVVDPARFAGLARAASEELAYLFDRQLAEADVIGLNKADLDGPAEAVRDALSGLHPGTPVLPYSARTGAGLAGLADALAGGARSGGTRDLDVDYDVYAAAEARLAWLNHTVEVSAPSGFASARWAEVCLAELVGRGWFVGHAKVHLEAATAATRAAATGAAAASPTGATEAGATKAGATGSAPVVDADGGPMRRARARLNARIGCEPSALDAAVKAALAAADAATGAVSRADAPPAAFAPAYPRPVHRMRA